MNLRIMLGLAVLGVVSAGFGYGTYAAFTTSVTSGPNTFAIGTVELDLDDATGSTNVFIGGDDLAPGDTVSGDILVKNVGTLRTGDARNHVFELTIRAANSNDELAAALRIVSLSYNGTSLLGDGFPETLADLETMSFPGLDDPGVAGMMLELTVQVDPQLESFQGASNDLTVTFELAQVLAESEAAA